MDAAAVADAVAAATGPPPTTAPPQSLGPPPPPLPPGWLMKESHSNPGYYYYYQMDTGVSTWDPPMNLVVDQQVHASLADFQEQQQEETVVAMDIDTIVPLTEVPLPYASEQQQLLSSPSSLKHGREGEPSDQSYDGHSDKSQKEDHNHQTIHRERKRRKTTTTTASPESSSMASPSSSSKTPSEVRVLHILKKHKDSRRPSSWRNPKITATKEEAHQELRGLLDILQEEDGNSQELRATFEELARTESDCSSAKRGGDLGFFGRKKMQPAFEEASFALKKGELTQNIVDTSSGSHIILRIG